jgi:hypothetical protein
MDTDGVDYLKRHLAPLCDSLHDVFDTARGQADRIRREAGIDATTYNSLGADLTRGLVHRAIDLAEGIGPWTLTGDHNKRGQLMLCREMVRLRFLHDAAGEVPSAGPNAARRAYYRNVPLDPESLLGVRDSNLIAVWRVIDDETGEIAFRVVRPLNPEARRAPRGVQEVDLDFILPRTAPALTDLQFTAPDEDLQIDFGDDEEAGDADGHAGSGGS